MTTDANDPESDDISADAELEAAHARIAALEEQLAEALADAHEASGEAIALEMAAMDDEEERDELSPALRDTVKTQALAMLSADTKTAALAASFMVPVAIGVQAITRRMEERPDRAKAADAKTEIEFSLDDVLGFLSNPIVSKAFGLTVHTKKEQKAVAPNLTITGPAGCIVIAKCEGTDVIHREMPAEGVISRVVPAGFYTIIVYAGTSKEGWGMQVDLRTSKATVDGAVVLAQGDNPVVYTPPLADGSGRPALRVVTTPATATKTPPSD